MWPDGGISVELKLEPQGLALFDKPAAYQLVGEVTAHQGDDG